MRSELSVQRILRSGRKAALGTFPEASLACRDVRRLLSPNRRRFEGGVIVELKNAADIFYFGVSTRYYGSHLRVQS